MTVTNSRESVPGQVPHSPFDKQGEKVPCTWKHSFHGLWVHVAAVSGRSLLALTLLSPVRATILTGVSAPLSVWLLGSCYARSAAGAAVMYSCAYCGYKSLQAALRCHAFIHQGARGRENMLMVIQNIFQHRDDCGSVTP